MVINRVNRLTMKKSGNKSDGGRVGGTSPPASATHVHDHEQNSKGLLAVVRASSRASSRSNQSRHSRVDLEGAIAENLRHESENGDESSVIKRRVISIFFLIYGLLSFIYLGATIGIWSWMLTYNLEYFIRPPNTTPFFKVEQGFSCMAFKFAVGSLTHFILAIWALILFSGARDGYKTILNCRETIILWFGIIAAGAEILMISANVDYVTSTPILDNGNFRDTILPPPSTIENCSIPEKGRDDPAINKGVWFIRVNLKWFVEVLCGDDGDDPRYQKYLAESWVIHEDDISVPPSCRTLKEDLEQGAKDDCEKASFLHHTILAWFIYEGIGIAFVILLFYLSIKVFVKLTPNPRYSFTGGLEVEMEQMRAVAEKMRHFAELNNAARNHDHAQTNSDEGDAANEAVKISVQPPPP